MSKALTVVVVAVDVVLLLLLLFGWQRRSQACLFLRIVVWHAVMV